MKWKLEKLEDLVSLSKGKKQEETQNSGRYRYIQIEDLSGDSNEKYTDDNGLEVVANDVIIAWDGANAGRVGHGLNGIIGSTLARLRPKSDAIDGKYLYRFLQSQEKEIKAQRTGATIPHVNGQGLRSLYIPKPPLSTQQKIAIILDEADALRRKDKALLGKYDELLQAVFYDMFGDPVKNEKGWEVRKLSDVCIKITDGTHLSPKFTASGIPFLFVSNIVDNEITYKTNRYISENEYNELIKRTPVELGDVLLTTVGSYGNPALVKSEERFCFQRHIAYLKPNQDIIDPYFLFGILKSPMVKMQIEKKVRGVAQKTLNLFDLKNIEIFYPSSEVQKRFALIAQNFQTQKSQIIQQQTYSENLFLSLMQQAFKGELVE